MKIYFDASCCGLGNNGGSRTILKCCESLRSLGHESVVFTKVNGFNWFPSRHLISKNKPSGFDAAISASCADVDSVMSSNARKKAWYIRGHETWILNEEKLVKKYKTNDLRLLANSNGLIDKLKKLGVEKDTSLIYQGLDFDWWKDLKNRNNKKIGIGVLYSSKNTKRFIDFLNLVKILGNKEYDYYGFGSQPLPQEYRSIFKEYMMSPEKSELCSLYNKCHVWFAPTVLEGLHNPPMEAAMCGCLLVCNNNPLNGMIMDYALPETAHVYSDLNHAVEMIKNLDFSLVSKMKEFIKTNIGDRKSNMKKLVEVLK